MKWFTKMTTNHPVLVTVFAGLVLVGSIFGASSLFSRLDSEGFFDKNAESSQAMDVISSRFPDQSVSAALLVQSPSGDNVDSTEFEKAAQQLIASARKTKGVDSVGSFYESNDQSLVSSDQQKLLVPIFFEDGSDDLAMAQRIRAGLDTADLKVDYGGMAFMADDLSKQVEKDLLLAEGVSLVILAVLLIFIFRGLVAAGLPLGLGVFVIFGSLGVLRLVSEFMPVSQYAVNVIVALGLGLSIDYSLLVVARFREEIDRGGPVKDAVKVTMATAGKTVFYSGLTVIICLAALAMFPLDMLRSMGVGGMVSVGMALFAGLVILPALLTLIGQKINSWQILKPKPKVDKNDGLIWRRIARLTARRPIIYVLAVSAVLVLAGLPLRGLEIQPIDSSSIPAGLSSRVVAEAVENDFVSPSSDIQLVYRHDDLMSSAGIKDLFNFTEKLQTLSTIDQVQGLTHPPAAAPLGIEQLVPMLTNLQQAPAEIQAYAKHVQSGDTAVLTANFQADLNDKDQRQAIDDVRQLDSGPATVLVGGDQALKQDQLDSVMRTLPWAAGWILLAVGLIMGIMMRSVVIPIKAILMNALSLSVALGAVVWVFSSDLVGGWFGFNTEAGIDITAPLIIFTVAFGLSMDYSVFLYSRIREEYKKLGDTNQAVEEGLAKTGGVITSAALLLFVVVAAFTTSKISIMQQIGFGLAIGVLVDAFIVRAILVPSLMELLGKANWWLPRFRRKKS